MNKVTILSPIELMQAWKKGWPSYIINAIDDHPALIDMMRKSAIVAGEDLEDPNGQIRIKLALTAIATYCYETDYAKTTLFMINKMFQKIVHEMQYAKRSQKVQAQMDAFSDHYDRDKKKAEENIKLMEEGRKASKKWYDEHWTDEMEADYQAWKANGMQIAFLKVEK